MHQQLLVTTFAPSSWSNSSSSFHDVTECISDIALEKLNVFALNRSHSSRRYRGNSNHFPVANSPSVPAALDAACRSFSHPLIAACPF
jgi:hypothetical protein